MSSSKSRKREALLDQWDRLGSLPTSGLASAQPPPTKQATARLQRRKEEEQGALKASAKGYTLTQARFAEAVGISWMAASVLVRAFRLAEDDKFAILVRKGHRSRSDIVHFHPRAVGRFLELVAAPPSSLRLTKLQRMTLTRVRYRLLRSARNAKSSQRKAAS